MHIKHVNAKICAGLYKKKKKKKEKRKRKGKKRKKKYSCDFGTIRNLEMLIEIQFKSIARYIYIYRVHLRFIS